MEGFKTKQATFVDNIILENPVKNFLRKAAGCEAGRLGGFPKRTCSPGLRDQGNVESPLSSFDQQEEGILVFGFGDGLYRLFD